MAEIKFKGFQLVNSAASMTDKSVMYFVRTSGEKSAGTDGYIYFNGKKYGVGADAIKTIKAILGTGVTSASTVTAQLKAITDQLGTYNDAQASAGTKTDYISVTATTEHGQIKSVALANNVAVDITATTENGKLADAYAVKTALAEVEKKATDAHTTVTVSGSSSEFISVTPTANTNGGKDYILAVTGVTKAIADATGNSYNLASGYTNQQITGLTITSTTHNEKTWVQIKSANGTLISEFDAQSFVMDGMLSDAVVVSSYTSGDTTHTHEVPTDDGPWIKLTWNSDAGSKVTYIDTHSLVDVYTVSGDSTDYMSISNDYKIALDVTTSTALTDTAGTLADAKAVKDYVDDKVSTLSSDAVHKVSTGVSTTDKYIDVKQTGTAVTIDSTTYTNTGVDKAYTAIQTGTGDTLIGVVKVDATSSLTITATTKLVNAVASAETAIQSITGDGYIKATKNGTTAYTIGAETGLTQALEDRLTSVTVNGYTATTADTQITIATKDIKLGESITYTDKTGATGQTTGSTTTQVNTVLGDIYSKLAAAEKASYSGVTATGDTNLVSVSELTADNTQNVSLLKEVATGSTIAAGHIELNKNDDGTVYGQMYYSGEDAE